MDCLIIGCGLSGAVVARRLAEDGKKVVIWDRRNHIGGNMFDQRDEHGILIQKYGPHIFHTQKRELFEYMQRFEVWDAFHLVCGAVIDDRYTPTPFNFHTIDTFYPAGEAAELKTRIQTQFGSRQTATVVEVLENSDPMVRAYAQFLFDKDYSLYTAKQWGVRPEEIDVSVLQRVPLRFSYEDGYFDDPIQVLPHTSYTQFFKQILQHPNITVELEREALEHISIDLEARRLLLDGLESTIPVVYTGTLDELFGGIDGYLPYRSLRFEQKYEPVLSKQPAPVVAYPQAQGFTRITEYKKLPVQQTEGTSYAIEYPAVYQPGWGAEPYYPILTEESGVKYQVYRELAESIPNLFCCGRLADFKYYNMDQALERALNVNIK